MNNTKHRPILNYGAGKIMVTMSGFLYTWYWFINPYNVFPLSVFIDIFAYILLVQSFTHRHSISHLFALSPSSLCFSSFCLSIFLYRLIGLLLSIYLFSLSSVWFRLFILIFTLSLRLFNVYSLELPTCLCLFLGFTPLPSLSLCLCKMISWIFLRALRLWLCITIYQSNLLISDRRASVLQSQLIYWLFCLAVASVKFANRTEGLGKRQSGLLGCRVSVKALQKHTENK